MCQTPETRSELFVGIDVACAKGKRLPLVVARRSAGRLEPLHLGEARFPKPPVGRGNVAALNDASNREFAQDVVDYLRVIERTEAGTIRRIAIDAPRVPAPASGGLRLSEAALAKRGIQFFRTPSASDFALIRSLCESHLRGGGAISRLPHANKLWMLVGFALFESLGRQWECLEVFPQAIVCVLDAAEFHKGTKEGLRAQLEAAAHRTGWKSETLRNELMSSSFGSPHDRLDAFLSSWVASLAEDERVPLGDSPEDSIWVPRTDPRGEGAEVELSCYQCERVVEALPFIGVTKSGKELLFCSEDCRTVWALSEGWTPDGPHTRC